MAPDKNIPPCDSGRLLAQRKPLVTVRQLEQLEYTAVHLLREVGIRVMDEQLRGFFERRGYRVRDDRIRIDIGTVNEFLATERAVAGNQFAAGFAPASSTSEITVYVSNYPHHVVDYETGGIVPFATERLIEATKFADGLHARGVTTSPPGIPADVPPALQPVVQYWVAATFSRQGRPPVEPKLEESFPYVSAMADVLGEPLRFMTVRVLSPMTLASESLKVALRYRDRFDRFKVVNMPSMGGSASIHCGDAFAMAAAEVIGSAILLQERFEKPFDWEINLFPLDCRSLATVYGSPENFLLQLAAVEINAWFHGAQPAPSAGNIHSNAKVPGVQACTEKASLMTAGALLGMRHFGAAGTLSLDEVFSAEQLLYDLEIRDHVQRMVAGLDLACDSTRCISDVVQARQEKAFNGLESTAQGFREVYWQPTLFERDFLGGWLSAGSPILREKAKSIIRHVVDQHDFRLPPDIQAALNQILEQARRELH